MRKMLQFVPSLVLKMYLTIITMSLSKEHRRSEFKYDNMMKGNKHFICIRSFNLEIYHLLLLLGFTKSYSLYHKS